MFIHTISPVFLRIGILEIRYYGVIFALTFVLGYFIINKLVKKSNLNLTKDDVADLILYLLIGGVLMARIFEILFYEPSYFFANPSQVIALWQGGLSFHGGLLGGVIGGYLFCKKKKIKFLQLADLVSVPLALGFALGRIGNFLNSELYGKLTSLPWAVKFQGVEGYRHPSQLYESIKNFFIMFTLMFLTNKKLKTGSLFFTFLLMYGILRLFVEFVKDMPIIILGLTMGQLLSIPMIIVGAFMLWKKKV